MTYQSLKQKSKSFFSAVALERFLPTYHRRVVREGALIVGLVLALGLIANAFAKPRLALGVMSICAAIWLVFLALEAFFNSFYFEETSSVIHEPYRTVKAASPSYDVAKIIYLTPEENITKGFMLSSVGREVLIRLGISSVDITEFLRNQHNPISGSVLEFPDGGQVTVSRYGESLVEHDKAFKEFLLKHGASAEQFSGAAQWVERLHGHKRETLRFWSRDRLGRIKGIGKHWSYGESYSLENYALPVETAFSSAFRFSSGDVFQSDVDVIEAILVRSAEANCLIITDDQDAGLEVISAFAREISVGTVLPPLEHKRVMLLDENLLLADVGNKEAFERRMIIILQEVIKAGDLILVIEDLPAFIKNARTIGSEVGSILAEYIRMPSLQLIALTNSRGFHDVVSRDQSLAMRFENVFLQDVTVATLMLFLAGRAEALERENRIFFTYQVLETLAKTALDVFNKDARKRALDIITEVAILTRNKRERLVSAKDVITLAEEKSHINLTVTAADRNKLLNLEELLRERIIGQEEALHVISNALRRSRAGVSSPKRPVGSFLFIGPTGVGKTETTKALAAIMFGDESNIVRFDMSEFQSEDGLNRLIGGFGRDTSGLLATKLRDNPQGVLLLDEFEKTHPKVLDLFLQVLDEGMFTDASGERVNVRHMLIIATSNAGSDLIWNYLNEFKKTAPAGGGSSMSSALAGKSDELIDTIIKRNIFKPELLNRFDSIVLFHPLSPEQLRTISGLMLRKVSRRLEERGYGLQITEQLIDYVAEKGNDQRFGARALNRAIQEGVEEVVAKKILAGQVEPGNKIVVNLADFHNTAQ